MRINMKLEYNLGRYSLKVLNKSRSIDVLDFYYRNRRDFDKYESDKPASFYTENFISRMLEAEMKGLLSMTFVRFFLMDRHEPDYILGSLSFSHISRGSSPSANMGYKIDEYHRNEGLASLMIATALEDIVPDIGLHRTECYIHPDNSTSLHLMEKLGFIDEGIAHSYVRLNGVWHDHRRFVYIS